MRPFPSAVCLFFGPFLTVSRRAAGAATSSNMPAVSGCSALSNSGPSHPCKLTSHTRSLAGSLHQRICCIGFITCWPACLHASIAEQTWAPRSDQSFLPIDRSHRNGSRFMCSTSCSLTFVLLVHMQTTVPIVHPVNPSPSEPAEGSAPGIGGSPQKLSQGCRGSRMWVAWLLLLTCCPFFLIFLLT